MTEASVDDEITCRTLDGHLLEPAEATAASLIGHVRRIVLGADGVAVDAGRERRLFTGTARLAALVGRTDCLWPGCTQPVSRCEVDHLHEWAEGAGPIRSTPGRCAAPTTATNTDTGSDADVDPTTPGRSPTPMAR